MRVVLLTHGGADLVIDRLAGLDGVKLVGVFLEKAAAPKRTRIEKLKRSIRYDGWAATAAKFLRTPASHNGAADLTDEAAVRAGVRLIEVEDYHAPDSIDLIRSVDADLGVIYGTNIVRESVFSIPRLGSINLHQGLAPYYRGGPPVFWELFNNEPEIGLTVHFVAEKVDTGDIVLQHKVPLQYDLSFGSDFEAFIDDYRRQHLREDSARLIAEAVAAIASGDFTRCAQDISLGKRYRLPTKKEKDELRRRLRSRFAARGTR